jgi:hypothetical protein
MFRFAVPALLAAAALFFGSACANYRLGTGVEHEYRTVFIPPVATSGQVPQAAAILTTGIREAFIRDGRIRVVNTAEEADAVLTVTVKNLSRRSLTGLPGDSGLARSMGITLDAVATLDSPDGKKTWFSDRAISVERQIFTDDGNAAPVVSALQPVQQTQAEYQLVPQLSEALAERLKGAVLDTW